KGWESVASPSPNRLAHSCSATPGFSNACVRLLQNSATAEAASPFPPTPAGWPGRGSRSAAPEHLNDFTCWASQQQQFRDQRGTVLTLRQELAGACFALGKITLSAGALAALADAGQHAVAFLQRHVRGDWGTFGTLDQTELTEDERRRGW